jgi:hypothetical protein
MPLLFDSYIFYPSLLTVKLVPSPKVPSPFLLQEVHEFVEVIVDKICGDVWHDSE